MTRRPFPMGSDIPKVRHGIRKRCRKLALLQLWLPVIGAWATLQSELLAMRNTHHERGTEHGVAISDASEIPK